jgi:hypothetical protein
MYPLWSMEHIIYKWGIYMTFCMKNSNEWARMNINIQHNFMQVPE